VTVEARRKAYEAQAVAKKVRSRDWEPTPHESLLAKALEALADALVISTCIGSDPCGVCEDCKAQKAIATADAEAHRGAA